MCYRARFGRYRKDPISRYRKNPHRWFFLNMYFWPLNMYAKNISDSYISQRDTILLLKWVLRTLTFAVCTVVFGEWWKSWQKNMCLWMAALVSKWLPVIDIGVISLISKFQPCSSSNGWDILLFNFGAWNSYCKL